MGAKRPQTTGARKQGWSISEKDVGWGVSNHQYRFQKRALGGGVSNHHVYLYLLAWQEAAIRDHPRGGGPFCCCEHNLVRVQYVHCFVVPFRKNIVSWMLLETGPDFGNSSLGAWWPSRFLDAQMFKFRQLASTMIPLVHHSPKTQKMENLLDVGVCTPKQFYFKYFL